tara:strand:+ start:62 stop:1060 length:999 start_codon:yes stop_codon:yes gene_type:complete
MEDKECYNFNKISFEDGFFDDSCSATYIIHLLGNGRREDIDKQLNTFHPTNTVFILENKGFKKCKKTLKKQMARYDLIHCYYTIFKHAKENNYENILILEDDFIFDENILKQEIHDDINKFVNKKKNECFIYLPGCFPILQSIICKTHNRLFIKATTHCCIYSKSFIEKTLKFPMDRVDDWDSFTNTIYCSFFFNSYYYHKPLCYQLMPMTDNRKDWIYIPIISDLACKYLEYYKMDKEYRKGFHTAYTLSHKVSVFIFSLLFPFGLASVGGFSQIRNNYHILQMYKFYSSKLMKNKYSSDKYSSDKYNDNNYDNNNKDNYNKVNKYNDVIQ